MSLAIDFDTDHGYKKPPAWHLWQLQKLGFNGHADVYMGVFWNNKRQRTGATYPYATVAFTGTPAAGNVVRSRLAAPPSVTPSATARRSSQSSSQMRATINGMFSGVWADDNFGIEHDAANPIQGTKLHVHRRLGQHAELRDVDAHGPPRRGRHGGRLGTARRRLAGHDGGRAEVDSGPCRPVRGGGHPGVVRVLDGGLQSSGRDARQVPVVHGRRGLAGRRTCSSTCPRTRCTSARASGTTCKQMYKECADQIAAAGLPVVLQFGETQWWYFDNRAADPHGGMPFYDQDTISAFAAAKGHQIWPFASNTDDPAGDPAHPKETADFLRDRIWAYCQDVIAYVRAYHPTAVFECLWPLDANQGKPAPSPTYRQLLMHVNLPDQWKTSSYGIKYFRCEGFDYDVWQKNATLMAQTISFANKTLGRPAAECMYLSGLYGPPDPPLAQAYGLWLQAKLYSMCFWAFDQFCLNSRPVPLEVVDRRRLRRRRSITSRRAARAVEVATRGRRGAARWRRAQSLQAEREEAQWLTIRARSTAPPACTRRSMRSPTKPLETTTTARGAGGRLRPSAWRPRPEASPRRTASSRLTTNWSCTRGKTGAQFTGCQRGAFGTAAASHSNGVAVKANMVAGFITALQSAVLAIENELGTAAARNYVRKDGAVTVTGLKTFQDGAEFGTGTKAGTGLVRLPNAGRGQVEEAGQLRRPRDGVEREQPPRDGRRDRLRGGPDVRRVLLSGRHHARQGHRPDRPGRRPGGRGRSRLARGHRRSLPARTRRPPSIRRGASRLARRWWLATFPPTPTPRPISWPGRCRSRSRTTARRSEPGAR